MPGKARRDRPIVVPTFGAYLKQLRGKTSRGKICEQLTKHYPGLKLDRSTLLQYERGTVLSPDPAILGGLARLYRVPLDDLIVHLIRDRSAHADRFSAAVPPTLDAEQRLIAEWFGRLSSDAREAIHVILEALAPRRLELEDDRRHGQQRA